MLQHQSLNRWNPHVLKPVQEAEDQEQGWYSALGITAGTSLHIIREGTPSVDAEDKMAAESVALRFQRTQKVMY